MLNESAIVFGRSKTASSGKTHIAVAIGCRAIQNGFEPLFVSAAEPPIVLMVRAARADQEK